MPIARLSEDSHSSPPFAFHQSALRALGSDMIAGKDGFPTCRWIYRVYRYSSCYASRVPGTAILLLDYRCKVFVWNSTPDGQ